MSDTDFLALNEFVQDSLKITKTFIMYVQKFLISLYLKLNRFKILRLEISDET